MEERHFILYQNEHNEQSEVMKTRRVEEVMADGKRRIVYSDIHFHNEKLSPTMCRIFKSIFPKQSKSRVWRTGKKVA